MSKSVKSDKWFLRVDGNIEFLSEKFRELSQNIDTVELLSVFHLGEKGENPHAHAVIRSSATIQKQSYAIRMKTLFSIDKKSQYALDVWDGDKRKGATSYLFHEEDAKILVNKGFTEVDIQEAKIICNEVQKVVKRNKEKASGRLVERALEKGDLETRLEILTFMLREIKEGNAYHPGEYSLKKYVEEVLIRKTKNVDEYARDLEARLWRD